MGKAGGSKKKVKKRGKRPFKKKEGWKISKIYDKGKSKNRTCPKCGPGVFLAEHKDRRVCGKCGYVEMKK